MCKEPGKDVARFLEETAHLREALSGGGQAQTLGRLPGQLGGGVERVANVEFLLLDDLEPFTLLGPADFRRGVFAEAEEIIQVPDAEHFRFAGLDKLLIRIVPDRLEDKIARILSGRLFHIHERLVDELREKVDDLE